MPTDMISDGASWLAQQQRTHCAKIVTYQRSTSQFQVAATVGQTEHRTADLMGGEVVAISRDFLVTASDLALNGAKIQPERGDKVLETIDGVAYTHTVMSIVGNDNHWRWADGARTTIRIHTKTTSEATA